MEAIINPEKYEKVSGNLFFKMHYQNYHRERETTKHFGRINRILSYIQVRSLLVWWKNCSPRAVKRIIIRTVDPFPGP
jgi:hypothetical protein